MIDAILSTNLEIQKLKSKNLQLTQTVSSLQSENIQLQQTVLSLQTDIKNLKQNVVALTAESNYRRTLCDKSIIQRDSLQEEIEFLKAKLKQREHALFGIKSEKSNHRYYSENSSREKLSVRGHQKGAPGIVKRKYSDLPAIEEFHDVPDDKKTCPKCGSLYEELAITKDSEVLEIDVKAHKRTIRRKQYKRTCKRSQVSTIIKAPIAPKILPKNNLGISIWTTLILNKFWLGQPLQKSLLNFSSNGLNIPIGTIVNGFSNLEKVLLPILNHIKEKNRLENHLHADETSWKVFEKVDGKVGNKWFLWSFLSTSTAVFILDPTCSSNVLKNHLNNFSGIISCDRYVAYDHFAKHAEKEIVLAYCWAHVRRDFLKTSKDPKLEKWALNWVAKIRHLYRLNELRINNQNDEKLLKKHFQDLKQGVNNFKKEVEKQLSGRKQHNTCNKILDSIIKRWSGLTVFVDHIKVTMDNNAVERALRNPVVGRKNYYGSGSRQSGTFASMMFSIIETLLLWQINPKKWLTIYFEECAINQSTPPDKIKNFLPWNMSEEEINKMKLDKFNDSS